MLPFWISIALLSLAQGAIVALAARPLGAPALRAPARPPLGAHPAAVGRRLRASSRGAAEHASAQGLTYLALVAVPLLAALALGWLTPGARPLRALLVPALFALAWADRGGLAGQAARAGALGAQLRRARRAAGARHAAALARRRASSRWPLPTPRWSSPTCCSAPTTRSTPRTRRPGCRGCRARSSGSAVMGYGDLFVAARSAALLALARRARAAAARRRVLYAALALALRPAVLLRRRAAGDRAGRAHADRLGARAPAEIRADGASSSACSVCGASAGSAPPRAPRGVVLAAR